MIFRPLFLSAIFFVAGTAFVEAATAPGISPNGDTFVSSANPGSNYGAAGALEVSATGLAKGEFDTFMRFNLGTTKTYFDGVYGAGNWTVQTVTLQLTTTNPNNALFNANAAGSFSILLTQSTTWVEGGGMPSSPDMTAGTLNYSNRNTYLGASDQSLGMFAFAGGTGGSAVYTLSLSAGLQTAVQTGSDASLYLAAADPAVSYLFNSANFGTAASRPTLVVVAVPEPGAGVFLAVIAGTLALRAIRHRACRHV